MIVKRWTRCSVKDRSGNPAHATNKTSQVGKGGLPLLISFIQYSLSSPSERG